MSRAEFDPCFGGRGQDDAVTAGKMHADEVETSAGLVRRLLACSSRVGPRDRSFGSTMPGPTTPSTGWAPTWSCACRASTGRPGNSTRNASGCRCLAPVLPVALPELLATGEPGAGYPWSWSVWSWIDGETATRSASPIRSSSPPTWPCSFAAAVSRRNRRAGAGRETVQAGCPARHPRRPHAAKRSTRPATSSTSTR